MVENASIGVSFSMMSVIVLTGLIMSIMMIPATPLSLQYSAKTHGTYLSNIAGVLTPSLLVLIAMQFVFMLAAVSIRITMVPIYASETVGLSGSEIGFIISIGAAVSFAFLFCLSRYASRVSRSSLIIPGYAILSISTFSYTIFNDYLGLLIATIVLSVAQVLILPLQTAYVADHSEPSEMGVAMAAFRTSGDLGILAGPILLGLILDISFPEMPFYVFSAIMTFATLMAFLHLRGFRGRRGSLVTHPQCERDDY
jgi:predicted MFS family arabinose efflux permease